MHRCRVTPSELASDIVRLESGHLRHLHTVLRIKPGNNVTLFDGEGATRRVEVAEVTRERITFVARGPRVSHPLPAPHLTLFACVSKGVRMELTIEKGVELGANRIVPVMAERTIARLDGVKRLAKRERWAQVAAEAARQSQAVWLPEIVAPVDFADSLALVDADMALFVASLAPGATPLWDALASWRSMPRRAGWFVGPEGDFTERELQMLVDAGGKPVDLGAQILRSETACIYGLCVLACVWRKSVC